MALPETVLYKAEAWVEAWDREQAAEIVYYRNLVDQAKSRIGRRDRQDSMYIGNMEHRLRQVQQFPPHVALIKELVGELRTVTRRVDLGAVPPGEYLSDELEARGWTQKEFAEMIGRPAQAVSEIVNAKKRVTAETALQFAETLGTSPELWMNLQTAWDLRVARSGNTAAETVLAQP